jgi:small-conductance mechanosensitive channel
MTFNGLFDHLDQYVALLALGRAIVYLVVGFFLAKFVSSAIIHLYEKQRRPKYSLLIRKIIFYAVFVLFVISALRELGFDLRVLLGATGILTVALGFASQTSASNFISGLFLLGERAFHVGDIININGVTGEVLSIDLFSVKLKQSDNTMVRIPNEMIIKTLVTNQTHFPIRRVECVFTVSPTSSLEHIRQLILPVLTRDPLCLKEPAPSLEIKEIADNGIKLQLAVWAKQKNFSALKYHTQEKLWETLIANKVAIADGSVNVKLIKGNTDESSQDNIS